MVTDRIIDRIKLFFFFPFIFFYVRCRSAEGDQSMDIPRNNISITNIILGFRSKLPSLEKKIGTNIIRCVVCIVEKRVSLSLIRNLIEIIRPWDPR